MPINLKPKHEVWIIKTAANMNCMQFDKIYGTVIYDLTDPEERQDFVWHMTENNVPNEDVKNLIDFLSKNELIDIDKIMTPIDQLEISFIDEEKLKEGIGFYTYTSRGVVGNKMKLLLSISLIIILSACGHNLKSENFLNADLKYSSYLWHLNQDMNDLEFSLFSYIHIDSNGRYKLIRHTTLHDNPQYFAGTLTDSVRKIIDSVLYRNKYLPEIKKDGLPDTSLLVYDGFTYLLDYKIIGKDRTKVQYINSPSRTPDNILFLTSLLDTIIFKTQANQIDSFSIGSYIDSLKKISSYNLPPPPSPPRVIPPNLKFIPPKADK